MQGDEPMRLEFDEGGVLHLRGRDGWREPICPVCRQPIRWVLDMASFTTHRNGSYQYGHARCLWTGSAFNREREMISRGET